jgi:hypothetical protein
VVSQCTGKDPFYSDPCEDDSGCSELGYVCSTYPEQCAEFHTCIFACHTDDDCNTERNSKCSKTPVPHYLCTCASDDDCHSFGLCNQNGFCSTY